MEFTLSLKHKEEDFINACIQKERWAQKQLYETYYSKMIGVCLRYARDPDEAKDILHEGFIKVFRHISKYQPGTSLNAWIKRIMVNTCIDYYRKMS
ncbi:MAG: RNA polymerase sigma factor (sigma-70 family), partial [Maribacter sp.]